MVIEESDNRLTLRYKIDIKHITAILVFIALGILLIWVYGKVDQESWIKNGSLYTAIVLLIFGIIMLGNGIFEFLSCRHYLFDREKGKLVIQKGRLFWKVIKVYQLLGIISVSLEMFNPGDGPLDVAHVTLSLHCDDGTYSSLFLSGSIFINRQKTLAERVATFLGIKVYTNEHFTEGNPLPRP